RLERSAGDDRNAHDVEVAGARRAYDRLASDVGAADAHQAALLIARERDLVDDRRRARAEALVERAVQRGVEGRDPLAARVDTGGQRYVKRQHAARVEPRIRGERAQQA